MCATFDQQDGIILETIIPKLYPGLIYGIPVDTVFLFQ